MDGQHDGKEVAIVFGKTGAGDVTRTRDLLITNQLLYQLSYAGLGGENEFVF